MNKNSNILKNKNIAFLGAGNMAEALINGFIKSGLVAKDKITASDLRKERTDYIRKKYGVKIKDNVKTVENAGIKFIAVKPKDVDVLLSQVSRYISKDQIIISIAAGITIKHIEGLICKNVPVVRTMPNTPALVGKGAIAISGGTYAKIAHLKVAYELFSSVGIVVMVDEKKLDAVTAVSGSGPAYVFYLSEAMEKAAEKLGLPSETAKKLVHQTILGAGLMLSEMELDAAVLRRNVTSPGGTTEAAIRFLESKKFETTVIEAIKKADKKAKELKK